MYGLIALTSEGLEFAADQLTNGYKIFSQEIECQDNPSHPQLPSINDLHSEDERSRSNVEGNALAETAASRGSVSISPSSAFDATTRTDPYSSVMGFSEEALGQINVSYFLGTQEENEQNESDNDFDGEDIFNIEINRQRLDFLPELVYVCSYISSDGIVDDCSIYMYDEKFSQGWIGGRNRSNACSFIPVVFSYLFLKEKVQLLDDLPIFHFQPFDEILYEALIKGNQIYDRYRRSLRHRYCSIGEVADLMAEICPFTLKEE